MCFVLIIMMFNGLLMCADSDTSDFTKESGSSSLPETSWDACARATYYHNKLMSTLQVLANKEETVRVQCESLRVAEARIASLTARAQGLRKELDEKAQELRTLQITRDEYTRPEKADISVMADTQEVENQKNVVKTLQTNLSVIEDLYRECFYETAKQEELIEMLRKSYLDVRLMDRDKCDQIRRLQNVVDSQTWSMEKCQDMAMEVEGLKMEISNFLSSSNNDSGMWERSDDSLNGEVVEDLQQIAAQLLQLRTMLTVDCICGLETENNNLKEMNERLQIQVGELRGKVSAMEKDLADKENADQTRRNELAEKEQELCCVRQRLAEVEESVGDRKGTCELLAAQLRQAQVSIEDQTRELIEARQRCQGHEATVNQLNEELERANHIIEEGSAVRAEVESLRAAMHEGERRARALSGELARVNERCRCLDACYKEKASCAATLQTQLVEAHARGAELCKDMRRVVAGVQQCTRKMRSRHRDQENKIKEQEALIRSLQPGNECGLVNIIPDSCYANLSLGGRRSSSCVTGTAGLRLASERDSRATCRRSCDCEAKMAARRDLSKKSTSVSERSRCNRAERLAERPQSGRKDSTCECSVTIDDCRPVRIKKAGSNVTSCECERAGKKKDDYSRTSGSEVASSSTAPTPPKRLLRKKFSPTEEKVQSWWWAGPRLREAGVQQPQRCDAASSAADSDALHRCRSTWSHLDRLSREASPSAQLEQRMCALSAALQRSQARWAHARCS